MYSIESKEIRVEDFGRLTPIREIVPAPALPRILFLLSGFVEVHLMAIVLRLSYSLNANAHCPIPVTGS